VSYRGQGDYLNPGLFEDGKLQETRGYVTDLRYDRAIRFVKKPRGERPFLLYIAHKAVHPDIFQRDDGSPDFSHGGGKHVPAERFRGTYANAEWPAAPNALLPDQLPAGKPLLRQILERRAKPEFEPVYGEFMRYTYSQDYIRSRAEVLLAVDDGWVGLRTALADLGQLDNTVIVFTSDNGEFFGAHGLTTEIRLPYEDALKVPLFIRYPPLIKAGTVISQGAQNIDLAPTLIELAQRPFVRPAKAGTRFPRPSTKQRPEIQGRSLVPLRQGESHGWRRSMLYELTSEEATFPWLVNVSYRAVRMGSYKYIHWISHEGMDELYDLERDPFELDNLIAKPGLAAKIQVLRDELARLVSHSVGL
jgi:arylsulfatase A-like enzyme